MATFIIIFPFRDKQRSDGWVRVVNAHDINQVANYADHEYPQGYAIYEEDNFVDGQGYYKLGCLEEVDFRTWHDYVT